MEVKTKIITCPNCGAPVSFDIRNCEYCDGPIVISTFNSVNEMPIPLLKKHINEYNNILSDNELNTDINMSIAICYLKLKLYDKAIYYFEKALEDCFDNSEIYFYLSISILKGKKAFLTSRKDIDSAIEYLKASIEIENRGIYYYFIAYLMNDHHYRKGYCINPNYSYYLSKAKEYGVSYNDSVELFKILNVDIPQDIRL